VYLWWLPVPLSGGALCAGGVNYLDIEGQWMVQPDPDGSLTGAV